MIQLYKLDDGTVRVRHKRPGKKALDYVFDSTEATVAHVRAWLKTPKGQEHGEADRSRDSRPN